MLRPYYPLHYFSGNFSILGLWLKLKLRHNLPLKNGGVGAAVWLEPLGQGTCTGPATSLPGCTVSPLQSPTALLAAVGKSLLLPTGATLWGGKCNYYACELCCESESKRNGKCCSGSRERQSLTNICICKSNHLSSEMFISPFP